MTSRYIKLLSASTAFVAVAAATSANAAVLVVNANQTTPVLASATTGVIVSGSTSVSVSTGPAIEVSNTGALQIDVSSAAVVRSSSVTGTIAVQTDSIGLTGLTVNNSGSIINTGGAGAISGTNSTATLTVNNVGTISGSVVNGAGAITYTANGGTQRGDITGTNSAGTDTVSFVGGSYTGSTTLGNGANAFTVSNSTATGNYLGGTGVDTINIKDNSTYTGNISTSTGADIINVSNSRVNGNITTGPGALATITLTNATVSGTITDQAAGDNDVLTINGQNTFTTLGAISGYENLNLNTNAVINHGISGVSALGVASGKSVDLNQNLTASAVLTNAGTINVAGGKTLQADSYTGTGGTLGIGITSSTAAGKLVLVTTGAAAPSVTINVASNAGYIASGTQFTIVDSQGSANTNAVLTSSQTGVYRFSTALNNGDISLTVGRIATSAVVEGDDAKGIATALDSLGASATGTLATVQGLIGSQSSAAGVDNIVQSLTPGIDGAGVASVNVAVDTGNQISNRLASLRGTGVATGDAMASQHMWVQGFGSTVDQDNHKGQAGYDANGGGVSIGADTDSMVDGMTTGLAISYGHSTVDSKGSGNASTDIDSYMATLYGSRVLDNGMFLNGQVNGGYNSYDMDRNIIGVGHATGDTNGLQAGAKVEGGKDYAAGGFTLTPLASLQYSYLDMDSYTETGAGGASLRVNPKSMSTVDAGAGMNLAYAIPLTDGGTLKPSAHAKYIYRMGDTSMGTTSNFTGGGGAFTTDGVKADRSSVNLGAGLLLTTVGGTDLSINYDADIRSNLVGHTGQLKARWAF